MINENFSIGDTKPDLFKALIAVQKELKPAVRDSTNPHFRSTYADLESCFAAGLPVLNKHGICLIQIPSGNADNGTIAVTTILGHESGQFISGQLEMALPESNPQKAGSAITYFKRYGFGAFIGLSTEEDDDGNKASPAPGSRPGPQAAAPQKANAPQQSGGFQQRPTALLSAAQVGRLYAIAKSKGWSQEQVKDFILNEFNKESMNDVTRAEADQLEKAMNSAQPRSQPMPSANELPPLDDIPF